MTLPRETQNGASIKSRLAESLVQNTEVSINIGGCIITTTEDKIRLSVHTHLSRMEERHKWVAPAGILVAIIAALVTADFKDRWLTAALWQAIFIVGGIVVFIWFLIAVFRAFKTPSIDDFVGLLRASQAPLGSNSAEDTGSDLAGMLISHEWVLFFNPPGKCKRITFLTDGTVGTGQNPNEHFWRLAGSKLELLQSSGRVHSRFTFDRVKCRWEHTNDPDTLSIRGQCILRADSVK